MAASRRKLFERAQPEQPLTPLLLERLLVVGQMQPLTPKHLADLVGCSERAARDHLRVLYHHDMVERAGVPRAVLADPDTPNVPDLLYGRAPTLYTLSRAGLKMLHEGGVIASKDAFPLLPPYGPRNWLFLAHELGVRDVRGWIARLERAYPRHPGLVWWRMGKAAWVETEAGTLRPDACFVYRLSANTLMRFVEVDRATERAPIRWEEKVAAYLTLLPDTARVQALTGSEVARVLVIVPNVRRREQVWEQIMALLPTYPQAADRFWLAERAALDSTDLSAAVWRIVGRQELRPLVAPQYL